jgi:hypothetical protein
MGCERDGARLAQPFVSVAFPLRFQLVPGGLSNCPEPANTRKWKSRSGRCSGSFSSSRCGGRAKPCRLPHIFAPAAA